MRTAAMDAPSGLWSQSLHPSRPLRLTGVERPAWDGRHPWGLVWCCADLPHVPEELLGTDPGELMVLQGAATLLSPSVTADIVWATREHDISHLFVLAHACCRLLDHALRPQQPATVVSEHMSRLGLFAGQHVDDVSRTVAHHSATSLRRELARHGLALEIITAFADPRGHLTEVRVEAASRTAAQLS